MRNKLRVVVCGTRFGRIYLKGIKQLSNQYELVGILARGSKQASRCALEFGVPLITNADLLDKVNVDLVCVVVRSTIVGGNGTEIAEKILDRGISVLQEQPIHYNDYVRCLKASKKEECHYSVNGFYSNLEISRAFIDAMHEITSKSHINYIDATCSVHVLFPLIEIIGKAMNGYGNYMFERVENRKVSGYFSEIRGILKKVPISLKVINKVNGKDPDNGIEVIHKISVGTNTGTLVLTDTNGMVVWYPRMNIPHDDDGILDMYGGHETLKNPVCEIIFPYTQVSYKEMYNKVWPMGIANVLRDFEKEITKKNKELSLSRIQFQMETCKVWGIVGELIGTTQNTEEA